MISKCLDISNKICVSKLLSLLPSKPLDYLENSSTSLFKLYYTGCLELKEALEIFWSILFPEIWWRTMIIIFQVLPSHNTKFRRFLFLDTRRSSTSLHINVSFPSSQPHYCCEHKTKQNPESVPSAINPGLIQGEEVS